MYVECQLVYWIILIVFILGYFIGEIVTLVFNSVKKIYCKFKN